MSGYSSENSLDREVINSPVKNRNSNLYVKNFDSSMDETKLCKLFHEYGTITSCKIAKDAKDRPKGFGFVNFTKPHMAECAVDNLNGYALDNGKKLYVTFFQNKNDRQKEQKQEYHKSCQNRNIYISNLDDSIDNDKLKLAFAEFGVIQTAQVMMKNGQSKGYGFICFSTADEAEDAIEHMNGKELGSKPLYVTLNKNKKDTEPLALSATLMHRTAPFNKDSDRSSETNSPSPILRNGELRMKPRFSTRLASSVHSEFHDPPLKSDSPINYRHSPINQKSSRRESTASSNED